MSSKVSSFAAAGNQTGAGLDHSIGSTGCLRDAEQSACMAALCLKYQKTEMGIALWEIHCAIIAFMK